MQNEKLNAMAYPGETEVKSSWREMDNCEVVGVRVESVTDSLIVVVDAQ